MSCCPRQQRQFSICQPTQRTRGSTSNYHQLQAGNAKQSDTRTRSCVKNSPRILMSSADIGHGSTQAVNVRAARHVTCVLALYLRMTIQNFLYKLYTGDAPNPNGKPPTLLVPRSLYTSLRASHVDRQVMLKRKNYYSSCFDGSTFSWPAPTKPHASSLTKGSIYANWPKHILTYDSKGETQKRSARTLPSLQPTRSRRNLCARA